MAQQHPNAQLEATLVQFGQQSGISQDQADQLRSAIASDPKLLGELNQAALANQLRGFALPAAGSTTPNLVGQYDLQTGVVSLPSAAFQTSGTVPTADLKAVMQVQEMTIRFGNSTYIDPPQPGVATQATYPVTQDMVDNLQSTINGSPALADEVKRAATAVLRHQPDADRTRQLPPHARRKRERSARSPACAGRAVDVSAGWAKRQDGRTRPTATGSEV